jgi:protein-tyrosine-phosphatase
MAEGLLRHLLAERGRADIEVVSSGTWGGKGQSATPEAVAVLRGQGVDISSHRSRPLDREDLADADVIVAMTSVHLREIFEIAPEAAAKTVLIKALAEMDVGPVSAYGSTADRIAALLKTDRPQWRRELDLDDPIGLPLGAYERCVREIRSGVEILADLLCEP